MSNESSPVSRRDFVAGTVVAAAALTCCGVPVEAAEGGTTFAAGEASKLKEGFNVAFLTAKKVILIKKGDTVFAETAVCTHRACTLKLMGADLKCACHGSMFDHDGKPTKGPAKDPLSRYGIELKGDKLTVDTS